MSQPSDGYAPRFGPRPAHEDAVQDAIYARMREFPHWCEDGHPPVGFTGEADECPLCEAIAALLAARTAEPTPGADNG